MECASYSAFILPFHFYFSVMVPFSFGWLEVFIKRFLGHIISFTQLFWSYFFSLAVFKAKSVVFWSNMLLHIFSNPWPWGGFRSIHCSCKYYMKMFVGLWGLQLFGFGVIKLLAHAMGWGVLPEVMKRSGLWEMNWLLAAWFLFIMVFSCLLPQRSTSFLPCNWHIYKQWYLCLENFVNTILIFSFLPFPICMHIPDFCMIRNPSTFLPILCWRH